MPAIKCIPRLAAAHTCAAAEAASAERLTPLAAATVGTTELATVSARPEPSTAEVRAGRAPPVLPSLDGASSGPRAGLPSGQLRAQAARGARGRGAAAGCALRGGWLRVRRAQEPPDLDDCRLARLRS